MKFEFATATQIIFGTGSLFDLGPLARQLGQQALVVIGSSGLRTAPLFDILKKAGINYTTFTVIGEPTTDTVRQGVAQARHDNSELVIGFGGGSVLDAGKAIAALLTNGGDPLDYLEVIGRGQALIEAPAPCIAIPTTAGTGSEVTRNAVLGSPEHRVKVSLRSPLMLPRLALVDPELTLTMPPPVTATTGLDALTQVIEPYVTPKVTPLTDGFCLEGMYRVSCSLRRSYEDGEDLRAREDMALASLCGGLALANAKLGAVHGFAGVLGGMFEAPHGAICAALLSYTTTINIRALRERQPEGDALERYDEVAKLLTDNLEAIAEDVIPWLETLCHDLQIPGLGAYGLTPADFPEVIAKTQVSSSMQGNPIKLTDEELAEILNRAL
jgi:alcohol dehydrogenase class IV